ncbi:FkbM family methyltransferase [Mesorhizobium sp. M0833]|uniref:FkbM family methyltransferase n=1 Tax=Mesorhizobium sp. M0833 TaxID=2957009 RepID=UPI0033394991
MDLLNLPPIARLHQRLFAFAYRLHEAELDLVAHLPRLIRAWRPDWPSKVPLGLDVGAGLGPYALHMLKYCTDVVVVEPNSAQAAYLRRTLGDRVQVIEAAASDSSGTAWLVDDGTGSTWRRPLARLSPSSNSHVWRQPCAVETVDRLMDRLGLAQTPGPLVAKIDVEGHELAVLQGMTALLHERPALIVIEIETRLNPNSRAVFDFFKAAGFECHVYHRGRLLPASHETAEMMAQRVPTRFARLAGYRSNFIFLR